MRYNYLGVFNVDIFDLGGLLDTKAANAAQGYIKEYVRDIEDIALIDYESLEYQVSSEALDEELDRYRSVSFSFVMSSSLEKAQLFKELFKKLRDIDTSCGADVQIESYFL